MSVVAVRRSRRLWYLVAAAVVVALAAVAGWIVVGRHARQPAAEPPGLWLPVANIGSRIGQFVVQDRAAYLVEVDGIDPTEVTAILAWDGATWHQYTPGAAGFARAATAVRAGDAKQTGQPDAHGVLHSGTQTYLVSDGLARRAGGRWLTIPLPTAATRITHRCADGHGGVWLSGKQYYHYTGSRWYTYPFAITAGSHAGGDLQVSNLTLVPGTGTVLSIVESSGEEEGVSDADIEQYVTDAELESPPAPDGANPHVS